MIRHVRSVVALLVAFAVVGSPVGAKTLDIGEGKQVYVSLDQVVLGKKKLIQVGDPVSCRVWRDVVEDGYVIINSGAYAMCRVDEMKTAKVAGVKGKLVIGVYEAEAVDGTMIQMSGGYNKAGKGRMALSISLAAIVAWPLIFIKGKAARLERGAVIDAYVGYRTKIKVDDKEVIHSVDLSGLMEKLSVEVLYDRLEAEKKPKNFEFRITTVADLTPDFGIDSINGQPVDRIPLVMTSNTKDDDEQVIEVEVPIKVLAKQFQKGINRFDIACEYDGERLATEVVLDIQF